MTIVRLLPFAVADGPRNMAADEVLLESAGRGQASLRLYGWRPPTLSLGYFQRHQDRLQDAELAKLPWLRRPTGGGAIVHAGGLTYALALPASLSKTRRPVDWHIEIHQIMAALLCRRGLGAEMVSGERLRPEKLHFLCFAVPQPGDVVLGDKKIVGGAQRLKAGALLQHGSIQGLASGDAHPNAEEIAEGLGWEAQRGDWTRDERARIEELVRQKYTQAWWNEKR